MKKDRTTILNTVLALVLGITLLVSVLVKVNCPHFILPKINIPYMAGISLLSLVLTHFLSGTRLDMECQSGKACMTEKPEGCPICQAVLAAVTFALLPWAAGFAEVSVIKLALCGGIVFAVLNAMFCGMVKRIELADTHKGAVIPAAFGLYLACQCFTNIFI